MIKTAKRNNKKKNCNKKGGQRQFRFLPSFFLPVIPSLLLQETSHFAIIIESRPQLFDKITDIHYSLS